MTDDVRASALETLAHDGLTLTVAHPARATRPPVLMIHGIFGGAWYFEKYQRHFAEHGYPAYAVNLRGHADSRPVRDLGRVSLVDYVTDASDAARMIAARHGAEPPIVIGHSMGGLIAQCLATSGDARAIVLLCSAPPRGIVIVSWRLLRKELKYAPAILFSRPLAPNALDVSELVLSHVPLVEQLALADRLGADSGRAARELALGTVAVDARRVRCPVLVAGGADDLFVPPRVTRRIAKRYHTEPRLWANHGHFLIWEPGWEECAAEVIAWLDRAGR